MDQIKRISNLEFRQVLALHKFDQFKLAKDYFLTLLLYLIKDVEGIYFKGGTALNKVILNHARLSEDQKNNVPSRTKVRGLTGTCFLDAQSVDHILKNVVLGRHLDIIKIMN